MLIGIADKIRVSKRFFSERLNLEKLKMTSGIKVRKIVFSENRIFLWSLILGVNLLMSGCSQVPDAVNPLKWYKSSVSFFSGEEDSFEKKPEQSSADKSFPKLASVSERKLLNDKREEGLIPDKQGRNYSKRLKLQSEPIYALGAPPPKPSIPLKAKAILTPRIEIVEDSLQVKQNDNDEKKSLSSSLAAGKRILKRKEPTTEDQLAFATLKSMENRLVEIKKRAYQRFTSSQNYRPVTNSEGFETIVVSSAGVDSRFGQIKAPTISSSPVSNNKPQTSLGSIGNNVSLGGSREIKVATIMFANSSSKISSRDRSILKNVLRLQKERGGKIRIIGHASSRTRDTDSVNHKMINFNVSAARAEAVARELVRMGLERTEMQIDALSDSSPVYFEVMPSGEAGNRRAEIFLRS